MLVFKMLNDLFSLFAWRSTSQQLVLKASHLAFSIYIMVPLTKMPSGTGLSDPNSLSPMNPLGGVGVTSYLYAFPPLPVNLFCWKVVSLNKSHPSFPNPRVDFLFKISSLKKVTCLTWNWTPWKGLVFTYLLGTSNFQIPAVSNFGKASF